MNEPTQSPGDGGRPELPVKAETNVIALVKELATVLPGLPKEQRVAAWLSSLASAFSFVGMIAALGYLAYQGSIVGVLVSLIVGLVGIFVVLLVGLRAVLRQGSHMDTRAGEDSLCSLLLLEAPKESKQRKAIRTELDALRSSIYDVFKAQKISVGTVRAGIFLPDLRNCEISEPFKLSIPPGLASAMSDADSGIRIAPSNGLVGWVFQYGFGHAIRSREVPSKWEGGYPLSEDEANSVSPRVRWVVGWPVTVGVEVCGVICVDGLDVDVPEAMLLRILGVESLAAGSIAELLSDNSRRLEISVVHQPSSA